MDEAARKLFGAMLRHLRRAANLSQPQLARQIRVSQASLSRYESGIQSVDAAMAARLDELLEAGGKLLATSGIAPVAEFAGPVPQVGGASVLEPPWSITGTMQALHEVARCAMDRRKFLIITGVELAGLGRQWGSSCDQGTALPAPLTPQPRSISTAMLDRLDHRLADLRRLDDEFGGRELHQLAVAELRWLTRLAEQAAYDGAAGQRLFSLVTEAARLCGWLHFDAAHHAAAQSYYVAALRSSASADDRLSGAHVLAGMSFQATLAGHHIEAVSLIHTAEERTRNAATPRLRALLASRKARAHAKAGDSASCGRALNEAERRLDAATPGTAEPDWIYYFDHTELEAQAAACWVDLHEPGKARPLIDRALSEMNPRYVRDRTIYHVRSAEAHMHTNELEMACDSLHVAAELAHQTGSVRSIHTIRGARQGMARHSADPRVKKLDRHLADLTSLVA